MLPQLGAGVLAPSVLNGGPRPPQLGPFRIRPEVLATFSRGLDAPSMRSIAPAPPPVYQLEPFNPSGGSITPAPVGDFAPYPRTVYGKAIEPAMMFALPPPPKRKPYAFEMVARAGESPEERRARERWNEMEVRDFERDRDNPRPPRERSLGAQFGDLVEDAGKAFFGAVVGLFGAVAGALGVGPQSAASENLGRGTLASSSGR